MTRFSFVGDKIHITSAAQASPSDSAQEGYKIRILSYLSLPKDSGVILDYLNEEFADLIKVILRKNNITQFKQISIETEKLEEKAILAHIRYLSEQGETKELGNFRKLVQLGSIARIYIFIELPHSKTVPNLDAIREQIAARFPIDLSEYLQSKGLLTEVQTISDASLLNMGLMDIDFHFDPHQFNDSFCDFESQMISNLESTFPEIHNHIFYEPATGSFVIAMLTPDQAELILSSKIGEKVPLQFSTQNAESLPSSVLSPHYTPQNRILITVPSSEAIVQSDSHSVPIIHHNEFFDD
jgi:hypothetical protein